MSQIDGQEIARLCSRLIQYDTSNPPGNEAELAEYVAAYMRDAGLEVEVIPCGPKRASVIGRLKGSGEVGPVLFSGHLDTFPVTDQEWMHEPFGGEISDGKVWGRGASDMKGGDAAMLVVARMLAERRTSLRGDLILAFSADEEATQIGTHTIAERLRDEVMQIVLIPEPTENEVLVAEKGALWVEVATHGKAGHISRLDEARNALLMMWPIIDEFTRLEIPFEVHPLLGGMVRSVNMIEAGQKMNIIPDRCAVTLEMRIVPGQDHADIIARIEQMIRDVDARSSLGDSGATVKMIHQLLPVETDPQLPALQRLLHVVAGVTGVRPQPKGIDYGTDACVLIPVLRAPFAICGPGSYEATAATDEWVKIDKMTETAQIYMAAALEYLG